MRDRREKPKVRDSSRFPVWSGVCVLCVLLAVFSCKKDTDILATYKGGTITRGEFYEWLDMTCHAKEKKRILGNIYLQPFKLKEMALERITVSEAVRNGYDRTPRFQALLESALDQELMKTFLRKEVKEKVEFDEPLVRISQIYLSLEPEKGSDSGGKTDSGLTQQVRKAEDIITRLKKGEEFDSLAKEYSQSYSRKRGSDIGYQFRFMLPPVIAKAASSLDEGEVTARPIVIEKGDSALPAGVYLIKVTEKKRVTRKNIDAIVEDKEKAHDLRNILYSRYLERALAELKKDKDVRYFPERIQSRDPSTIIFQIGSRNYTSGDLDKKLQKIAIVMGESPIDNTLRTQVAQNMFQIELVRRHAERNRYGNDPEYKKNKRQLREVLLEMEYTNKLRDSFKVQVKEDEIRKEYETHAMSYYYRLEEKGGRVVKVPQPFDHVREIIRRSLRMEKIEQEKNRWDEEKLQDYQFKVIESNL